MDTVLGLNRWDFSSPAAFAASVARAEELGWGQALVPCNPSMTFDPYLLLAEAGRATRRITLGPFIDNPVLRHPSVLAGAAATLDVLFPGRARLVLGVGDTAVRFVGRRPATVAELERAAAAVRGLLRGEEVDFGGRRPVRLWQPRPAPVWIAAGGPRTIAMAAGVADGVYLRVGRDPVNLGMAVGHLIEGAAAAGRDPAEIGIGLVLHTITSQDPVEIPAISRSLAASFYEYSPALFEAAGIEWAGPPVAELKRQVWPDFVHTTDLVGAGRLVGFLSDRAAEGFSLFGTPAEMAGQLRRALRTVSDLVGRGVDVVVPHPVPTPPADSPFPRWFVEEVWPLV